MKYEYIIVGAGITGCVLAERLAAQGAKVMIIDKRSHIGGNCYDFIDDAGVLIHKYGPHYFRTNYQEVFEYLSKFTEWTPHRYKVKVRIKNKLYTFPINITTLEEFFKIKFETEKDAEIFMNNIRIKNLDVATNAEEEVLKNWGYELYNAFFKGYTLKQWGVNPKLLDPTIIKRIPLRLDRNEDYLSEDIQVMPKEGYTKIFEKMLKSKNIHLKLNTPFNAEAANTAIKIIWTGPIDQYFQYSAGKLEYRSLDFKFFSFYGINYVQEEGQINYPDEDVTYTRIVEIKHVTHQKIKNTTISIEFPKESGEEYYPVPTKKNAELLNEYNRLAAQEKKVYFAGRLGKYKYLNMDQAVKEALELVKIISKESNNKL